MSATHPLVARSLPPSVHLVDAPGTLPRLDISTDQGTARVYFHGAHLAAWHPLHSTAPVLWLSGHSFFQPDRPIRGGVPVCFPWFGAHASDGSAPAHGFARLVDWTLTEADETAEGAVTLAFSLHGVESPAWPHRFRSTCRFSIGSQLAMALEVHNAGDEPFTFEEALHTYFAVQDIEAVTVDGLRNTDYLDKVADFALRRQGDEPIRFTGETDRAYSGHRHGMRPSRSHAAAAYRRAQAGIAVNRGVEPVDRQGAGDGGLRRSRVARDGLHRDGKHRRRRGAAGSRRHTCHDRGDRRRRGAASALKERRLQRPCLQPRELHHARGVKPFREDHPAPQLRRVLRHVPIRGEASRAAFHVAGRPARTRSTSLEDTGQRGEVICRRQALGSNPDFVRDAPRGAAIGRRCREPPARTPASGRLDDRVRRSERLNARAGPSSAEITGRGGQLRCRRRTRRRSGQQCERRPPATARTRRSFWNVISCCTERARRACRPCRKLRVIARSA